MLRVWRGSIFSKKMCDALNITEVKNQTHSSNKNKVPYFPPSPHFMKTIFSIKTSLQITKEIPNTTHITLFQPNKFRNFLQIRNTAVEFGSIRISHKITALLTFHIHILVKLFLLMKNRNVCQTTLEILYLIECRCQNVLFWCAQPFKQTNESSIVSQRKQMFSFQREIHAFIFISMWRWKCLFNYQMLCVCL